MKRIFLSEEQIQILKNKETFFNFKNQILYALKALLKNPYDRNVNITFGDNQINRHDLIKNLLKRGLLVKKETFDEVDNESIHKVTYQVPKSNFKEKLKRLFDFYQSKFSSFNEGIDNMIDNNGTMADEKYPAEEMISETDCVGVGAIGDGSDSSGQFIQPLTTKVQRRKIYQPK